MEDRNNVIKLDVLDEMVTSALTDIVCMAVLGEYGRFDITEEEFEKILNGGLRESLVKTIENYYESWGNITIEISDNEYYRGLMQAINEAV
jgi:hypothetical protein